MPHMNGIEERTERTSDADLEAVHDVAQARHQVETELGKRIVGQKRVIDQLLIALLSGGHCLFVGVPGLAKTLLVSSLAELLNLTFSRIQFTPDLMPSDITGTEVLQQDQSTKERYLRFIHGPVFANLVLADEINRTPPKTQAALLQAMQEYRVSVGGETHELALPFLVFATQNPIEQEGTYPLPEAQLDRFMLQVDVDYPTEEEEIRIVSQVTSSHLAPVQKVLGPERIRRLQELVLRVPAADHVIRYAVALCRASRPGASTAPEVVNHYLSWGAGPRASQHLILAAKAKALLEGRYAVQTDDVQQLLRPVLRHRLVRSFRAEAESVGTIDVIDGVLRAIKAV